MKKIGITGVHASGKTTKSKELYDRFVDTGKTVCVVHEVARSCPYAIGTIEAQEWIWQHQMAQERSIMYANVDIVICDRTVMDNLMYYFDIIPADGQKSINRWRDLYQEAVEWMPTYSQVIRLPINLDWLQSPDPIRPKSEAYARRIDALFDRFVQKFVTNHG